MVPGIWAPMTSTWMITLPLHVAGLRLTAKTAD